MSFLVPKPIGGHPTKIQSNCGQTVDNSSIFERIHKLVKTPKAVERLDEREFVSKVFEDIRELCRRPELLKTIDDELREIKESESTEPVVETTVYQKKKIQNYSDSNESNSFDIISKSKIFATLVKGGKGKSDQKSGHSVNQTSDENSVKTNAKNTKHKNNVNNRKSPKKRSKCEPKTVRNRKPLLSIDCDITSKISEYSKQFSKPKKRSNNRKKSNKKSDPNKSFDPLDSGFCSSYEEMAMSPMSTTITCSAYSTITTYSMPATPISSIDSISSGYSCESSSSVLSQIRKKFNKKFETYGEYIQRCAQKEMSAKKSRRKSKAELHFKEKVLQWSNKICSGNTTPVHNTEYLVTPPGSPQKATELFDNTSDELNAMIESLENIETNDGLNNQFNELLGELFAEL